MSESLQEELTKCYEARKFEQQRSDKRCTQLQAEIERQQVQIETQRVQIEEQRCQLETRQAQIASLKAEIARLGSAQP